MYDNDIVPQEHIDVELTIGSILTSNMTAPGKLLCILVLHLADADGWARLTYNDIGPLISRPSVDGIKAAIKSAEDTGFLLVEREPDKYRQITRFMANRYRVVTNCPTPISVQRMSPESGVGNQVSEFAQVAPTPESGAGNDPSETTMVFPQVSPTPESGDTITSNFYIDTLEDVPDSLREYGDENQDPNLAPAALRAGGDQNPIVVPDPVPGCGDQKNDDVTTGNPFTRPDQAIIWCRECDIRVTTNDACIDHETVCQGCGTPGACLAFTETGHPAIWCTECDPGWDKRYEKALENHAWWDSQSDEHRVTLTRRFKEMSPSARVSLGLPENM